MTFILKILNNCIIWNQKGKTFALVIQLDSTPNSKNNVIINNNNMCIELCLKIIQKKKKKKKQQHKDT